MAANTLSYSVVHMSSRIFTNKFVSPIFSSHPPVSSTTRRAPLSCFSLEAFAVASPSLFHQRNKKFTVFSASSSPDEVEAEDAAEEGQNEEALEYAEDVDVVAEEKPPRKPRIKLGDIMGILNKRAIEASEKLRPVPELRTGDIVQIKLEVPENRKRLSIYKGIIISRQNAGIHTTIRIRRIIAGIGVEIVFPMDHAKGVYYQMISMSRRVVLMCR